MFESTPTHLARRLDGGTGLHQQTHALSVTLNGGENQRCAFALREGEADAQVSANRCVAT